MNKSLITINPDIRIAVVDILQWLAAGMTNEEIYEDFPQINSIKNIFLQHLNLLKKRKYNKNCYRLKYSS
jgi:hypothetical protein